MAVCSKQYDQGSKGTQLAILMSRITPVPMVEALEKAKEAGAVIASNKRLDEALLKSKEWCSISGAFPCVSGTLVAYEKPDQKLKKTIEYRDPFNRLRFIFPVPEEHVGRKNALLVAEPPGYTLERDGKNAIIIAAQVELIKRFPIRNGWYHGDPMHGIPCGQEITAMIPCVSELTSVIDSDIRYLLRTTKRVGLVSRSYYDHVDCRVHIDLKHRPSDAFGLVVESTCENAEKIKSVAKNARSGLIDGVSIGGVRLLSGMSKEKFEQLTPIELDKLINYFRMHLAPYKLKDVVGALEWAEGLSKEK